MPKLYVRCKEKNCSLKFASGIVMDRKSLETSHSCGELSHMPQRTHLVMYNKHNNPIGELKK
jgi:hypothetical protein